ncbi:MAG: polymer-forming cytoskeletal protein [Rickettsiales bacterium]|nr:polymer-forming cytoskeletal protein [Rickettsiales bacterium]
MPIANLKAKIATIANDIENEGGASTKKIELITPNFKTTPTILARDLTIVGELTSSGMIEIEGRIKGTVRGNLVILRENGFIEGDVFAESLSIRGSFEGNIHAQNIDISSKAKISGEINYGSLSVEDGACIDARFKKIS